MSDTQEDIKEVEVEAEAAAPAEQRPRNNDPIEYDKSLLIMEKGKVKQPKQPDHTESRLLIGKLQAEITKRGDRIKEIKTIEEQLRGQAKGAFSGNKEVLSKLQELRGQRGTILRQKNAIREELRSCDSTRESVRAEMRSIRDKNRNIKSIDKIEEELAATEFKLQHESLPEQEEKRLQTLVQNLNQVKPLARKYAEYEARLKDIEAQRGGIMGRLKESDGVITELDEQIKVASGVLDDAKAKSDGHAADLPTLQVEKKENYEIMVALRAKIDEMRKQNDEEYNEYIKRDRAFRGYQREQKRVKYEERQKERDERYKEQNQEEQAVIAELGLEPYHAEIFTCEQLLGYLRSFGATVKEEVQQVAKEVEIPSGMKAFKKVEVQDEMFSGVPKKQKEQPKGKAAPAAGPSKPAEAKPKVQKLNHTLDMLKVFLQLKVEPPTTTATIPTTITRVEERIKDFLRLREEAKKAPKQAPKPAAAAAPAAEANGNHHSNGNKAEEAPASAAKEEEPAAPAPAPAKEAAAEPPAAKAKEAAAEEPAPAAKASPAPKAKAPEAAKSGDGVDVKLQVSGDKVSLKLVAA